MKHKILITGALDPLALRILEAAQDVEVTYRPDLPYAEVLASIAPYHALISRSETDVPRELIDRGASLRVIARAAVGVGNIDVDHATERGVLVINTPGKNTNSAAELTLGLLLAAVRNMIPAHNHMLDQGWDRHRFTGTELLHKTLGIIGLGHVGGRVARFARAFDMDVLAYDPYISSAVFEDHHARQVDLETLLRQSDVITVHVPKTRETTGMIGAAQIALMKDGVILLNAARGGLIEESALRAGLAGGKVRAAGIDTWSVEPVRDNPLRGLPNVVMTPHIGASTVEAQHRIAESVAEQVLKALRDEVVDYPVNMPRMTVLMTPRVKGYTVLAERLGSFAVQSLDFNPRAIQVQYRGELTSDEGAMIRRAFLKGFLKGSSSETVSFVNAEQKAAERHIQVSDVNDPGFSDYPSAIRFEIVDGDQAFSIAGVVFGANNYRIAQINEFNFEVIPEGHLLSMVNIDRPGVIGDVGTLLARNGVNISQFELSRNMPGGKAMSLLRVDSAISPDVLSALRSIRNMVTVRMIRI